MLPDQNDSDETLRWRRTMRDLEALSALPSTWTGLDPEDIAGRFAEVLSSTLDLDLIYIRLARSSDSGFTETLRSKHRPDTDNCISEARVSLASLLGEVALAPVTVMPDPFGTSTLRMTVVRFGLVEEHDVLIAGSPRANFPTEQERLLLAFAA